MKHVIAGALNQVTTRQADTWLHEDIAERAQNEREYAAACEREKIEFIARMKAARAAKRARRPQSKGRKG
jgi:GAF domain-containing protein